MQRWEKIFWWCAAGFMFVVTLVYLGHGLDKEQKQKDKIQYDRPSVAVMIPSTTTTFLGGPQAKCEAANPGKAVEAQLLPNGDTLCVLKN